MPIGAGWDSPGARLRTERFQRRREEVVGALGPMLAEGLQSATTATDQSLTELAEEQGMFNLGRPTVGPPPRPTPPATLAAPSVTPTPTAGLPSGPTPTPVLAPPPPVPTPQPPTIEPSPLAGLAEAFAAPREFGAAPLSRFAEIEETRLRRGGEAAQEFFGQVTPDAFPALRLLATGEVPSRAEMERILESDRPLEEKRALFDAFREATLARQQAAPALGPLELPFHFAGLGAEKGLEAAGAPPGVQLGGNIAAQFALGALGARVVPPALAARLPGGVRTAIDVAAVAAASEARRGGRVPTGVPARAAGEAATHPTLNVPVVARAVDLPAGEGIVYSNLSPTSAEAAARGTGRVWTAAQPAEGFVKPQNIEGSGTVAFRVRSGAEPIAASGRSTVYNAADLEPLGFIPEQGVFPEDVLAPSAQTIAERRARGELEVPEAVARRVAELPDEVVPPGTVDPQAPPLRAIGGGAQTFGAPLRPFDQVVGEVVTSDNPVQRALIGKTGINPSILNDTPLGRSITGYWRQRVAADELTDLAVTAGLDVHTQRFTGLKPAIRIPQIGRNRGLVTNIRPKREGASLVWQDVFSRPSDYNLNAAQKALIDDYHRIIDEVEFLRVQAGLKPRATRGPEAVAEGYFYTPRQVKGVRGTELRRPSNPGLQRHFDEAVEGRARGIDYDADFRATAELHVRQGYREVAEKQLSDHLELLQAEAMQRGERLFVTPKELVPEPVMKRYSDAVLRRLASEKAAKAERELVFRSRRQVDRDVIRLRAQIARERETLQGIRGAAGAQRGRQQPLSVGRDIAARQQRIDAMQSQLAELRKAGKEFPGIRRVDRLEGLSQRVRTELTNAMAEHQAAKRQYGAALATARRAEIAPGSIFGQAEDTIPIAQWRNRFFRREEADQLREGIENFFAPGKQSPFITGTLELGNFVRFLASVGDFAEPFIQGQLVFGADPASWAKSAGRHYQAFFDPSVQARVTRDFLPEFQEMAAHGTPIGDPEFFAALRPGQGISPGKLLEFLPGGTEARHLLQQAGKQTFGRFQASYNTGLGSSRAMLTRVFRDTIPDAAERQSFIRSLTGGLDSRALGVGPGRRAVEGFLGAFSPRLLRSTVALMADLRLGLRNPKGLAAWRSLATLASTATGLYVLAGLGLGKSWDEIKTGLNPLEGKKFLSHEVNDDWIGIGGQIRSIAHLLAKTAVEPEGLLDWDQFDNPLIAFYMSRGAPALGILGGAAEAATGGAVDVLPYDEVNSVPDFLKHVGTSALPFMVQGLLEGEGAVTSGAALAGARTSAETPGEELARRFEERENRPYNRETDRGIVETKYPDLVPLLFQSEGRQTVETALEGPVADLAPVAEQVRQNNPAAGPQFRNQYSDFKKIAFGATSAAFADVDFRDPESEAGRLRQEFNELNPFSEQFFDVDSAQPDWFAFGAERDRLIGEIDALVPGFKDAYEARLRLPAELQDVETRFLQAQQLRNQLSDIPQFRGISVERKREIDAFLRRVRAIRDRIKDERGPDSPDVPTMQEAIERAGQALGKDSRFILEARALQSTSARQRLLNLDYVRFIVENAEQLLFFYPELRSDTIRRVLAAQ